MNLGLSFGGKILMGAATILLLSACDAPRSRRGTTTTNSNGYSYFNPANSGFGSSSGAAAGSGSGTGSNTGSNTGTGTTPVTIPNEIKHCSWSMDGSTGFDRYSAHLGNYTFCKSSANELDVYLQVKTPSNVQICIIPTTNSGNQSTYIGEPRCLVADTNSKVYKVTLLKNRSGYSNYALTGAMIMKDQQAYYPGPYYQYLLGPDAYLFCAQWLAQTGDSSYCIAFNQVGQYVYHQF